MPISKFYEDSECYLSFAGCGFLSLYHAGVCACIQSYAPHLYRNRKIAGASAGALAAACMLCELDLNQCVEYALKVLAQAQCYYLGPFDPRFKISAHLREGLEVMLPMNAHEACSGRLYISLTSTSRNENVVVSHYQTRDDLIRALLCSAYIPIFSGFVPITLHGEQMIDGGITNNIPFLGKHTITVSPFAGEANICPRDQHWGYGPIHVANNSLLLNWNNLRRICHIVWPQSLSELQKLTENGYNDALRYLAMKGFIRCGEHSMIGSGRVVFLTLQIRTHHGLLEHCPECKRRLRDALNSSIPHSVLALFSSSPSSVSSSSKSSKPHNHSASHPQHAAATASYQPTAHRPPRWWRLLRLLASPTAMTMSILFTLIRRLREVISELPSPLQHLLAPTKQVMEQLNSLITRSLEHSSDRHEQARILCEKLKQSQFPAASSVSVQQPSTPPAEVLERPTLSSVAPSLKRSRHNSELTEDEDGFDELLHEASEAEDEEEEILSLGDAEEEKSSAADSDDSCSLLDGEDGMFSGAEESGNSWNEDLLQRHEVLQQMRALSGNEAECQVRVESVRPLDLNMFMCRDTASKDVSLNEEHKTSEPPKKFRRDFIDEEHLLATDSGHTSEADFSQHGVSGESGAEEAPVRTCWSYQDYEGSEVTKIFMVVPLKETKK